MNCFQWNYIRKSNIDSIGCGVSKCFTLEIRFLPKCLYWKIDHCIEMKWNLSFCHLPTKGWTKYKWIKKKLENQNCFPFVYDVQPVWIIYFHWFTLISFIWSIFIIQSINQRHYVWFSCLLFSFSSAHWIHLIINQKKRKKTIASIWYNEVGCLFSSMSFRSPR